MKNLLLYTIPLLFLLIGCGQKKAPIADVNTTTIEIKEENLTQLDTFDWQMNDEFMSQNSAAKMVVVKSKRVLVLFDEAGEIISRHRVSLGENPVGTKLKQGDYKTPEGTYSIVDKRSDPKYYKEILISYPNREDIERSASMGFNPGGGITFHAQVPWNWDGHGNDYTLIKDWTRGCIALTNEGIDSIWDKVSKSTIVEIRE